MTILLALQALAWLVLDRVCWTRIAAYGQSRCVTRSHYLRRCQEWRDDAKVGEGFG